MQRLANVLIHAFREAVERLVDVQRGRSRIDLQPEVDPEALRCRVDAEPDRREVRIRLCVEELDRLSGADRPFDVDRRRLAEGDLEAEVVRQRRLNDLLLDFAVQRDGELLAAVVLANVDQRVLFGELRERDAELRAVVGPFRGDDRLQRRRGEVMVRSVGRELADPVADLDLGEAPELGHCSCRDCRTLHRGAVLEDGDRRDLRVEPSAELQPLAHVNRPREHPHVRDLLAVHAALDLEHGPGDRAVGIAARRPAAGR